MKWRVEPEKAARTIVKRKSKRVTQGNHVRKEEKAGRQQTKEKVQQKENLQKEKELQGKTTTIQY